MFTSFPSAWLLVALPFVSAMVITQIPPLRRLIESRPRMTWSLGMIGLGVLFSELIGLLPASSALPVMLLAGAVSGFALFASPRGHSGSNGEDWHRDPPEDVPPTAPPSPPSPLGRPQPDWEQFDRLRAQWGQRPTTPPDRSKT
jgi:hypothetical protein